MMASEFYACSCGRYRYRVARKRHRPKGHLKKLWCPFCMRQKDMRRI